MRPAGAFTPFLRRVFIKIFFLKIFSKFNLLNKSVQKIILFCKKHGNKMIREKNIFWSKWLICFISKKILKISEKKA